MKNPIGWVEIPVTDLDRAEKFYTDFFGLELSRQEERMGVTMSWFPMDMDSYGSAATLIKGDAHKPSSDGALVYFTAPGGTVDAALEKASEQGVEVVTPKVDTGKHGFYAVIKDSEGNRIAIHSMEG